jgi:hypothetical protein
MGTAQVIIAGVLCGGATGSDVSHVTGSDISHRNQKYILRPSEAFWPEVKWVRKYVLRMSGFFLRFFP